MGHNETDFCGFRDAKPASGDVVDRYLQDSVRAALFGEKVTTSLGRLRIEGPLGQGAMGAVLLAFDPVLHRHVAVKSVRPERQGENDRLLAEARLLAKLDHPNVVTVFDVIEQDDAIHLVMERVGGVSLRVWMETTRDWRQVRELFADVGRGLAAAHKLGIAHSDVKPENIVVSDGRPVLIDFGLAFEMETGERHGGTDAYLAPERRSGAGGSPAADQYAFFAAMLEVINGERSDSVTIASEVPGWLAKTIERGLDPNPDRRFATMSEAVSALAPRQRSRGLLHFAAAAAVVASIGGAAFALAIGSDDEGLCDGAASELEKVWNQKVRRAMGDAVVAGAQTAEMTNQRGAELASKLDSGLDDYLGQWRLLRVKSCEATRVRGEQSDELLDFSMRCFDERLEQVRGAIRLFSNQPNKRVVEHASQTLTQLGDLSACTDPQALVRAVPLPESPAARQRLAELNADLEDLRNFDRRGEFDKALAHSETLAAGASEVGFAPLTARVLTLRGGVQVALGKLDEAEATFRAAATAAATAKDDKRLAEIWIRVLELLAQRGRFDEALTLEPVAVTSAERVSDEEQIAARLHNALGGIYLAKARYDDAYAAYKKALAIQRRLGSEGNRALAPAIANLGLAKWYQGDLAGALADQKEALELMVADLGADHSRVAYGHQNVADLTSQLGGVGAASAEQHYREALRIWQTSLGSDHANLAHPHEKLAAIEAHRGSFSLANDHLEEALRVRRKALGQEHPLVLQVMMVAIDVALQESSTASLSRARAELEEVSSMAARLGDAGKRYQSFISDSRASLAEANGDWSNALRHHRHSLSIRATELGESHPDTARSSMGAGRSAAKLQRYALARRHFEAAQAIYDKQAGAMDEHRIAVRVERGHLAVAQRDNAAALSLFSDALSLARDVSSAKSASIRFWLIAATANAGEKAEATRLADELERDLRALGESEANHALLAALKKWRTTR